MQDGSRGGRLGNGYISPDWSCQENEEEHATSAFTRFVRDGSNRLSMQFLGDGSGLRWADAAERAALMSGPNARAQSKSLPRDHRRKEPLGQANSASPASHHHAHALNDSDDDLHAER